MENELDAEIDKKIETRIDLRPTNSTPYQTEKPIIKPTMPLITCKKNSERYLCFLPMIERAE
ncbi:hypothetical protein [Moraxella marmotae]|uniref:hypothetical protein n=1 Tax=Moraxella marmotae TaxID=3344520 RepID=UPI0035F32BC5